MRWPEIDFYASLPHYRDHLRPIWDALPPVLRGSFRGAFGIAQPPGRWARDRLVVVAGWADAKRVSPRPFVYVEHGAGQSYDGDPLSARIGGYSGASGLEGCVLFLCPNRAVAERWQAKYPQAEAEVVGCPRLDTLLARRQLQQAAATTTPTVAVTFHWDCTLLPETRSAWPHYARRMDRIAGPWRVLAHGHPREHQTLARRWALRPFPGLEVTRNDQAVLLEADVLVADNTSLMWEAAALDIPLVVLDAPWYRRDVVHGLRFWEHADAGVRIDRAEQLQDAICEALEDRPERAALRAAAAAATYSPLDGRASQRAAGAIRRTMEG